MRLPIGQPNYLSRQEIDEKLADDEAFLGELIERQRELRAALRPMVDELKDLEARIAATEKAIAKWSERRLG